jgi:MYND finger
MQLVRLGADPRRKLDLSHQQCSQVSRIPEMDGKSAFQIAAMTNRRPLVALMWEHMQLSPIERAEIVHCRCGSRLPWKMCHSTGAGQPPHFLDFGTQQTYRISPLARCPCQNTAKTYYKCCWKDNGRPVYLEDSTGSNVIPASVLNTSPFEARWLRADHQDTSRTIGSLDEAEAAVYIKQQSALLRASPSAFQDVISRGGPQTQMASWDGAVYAGCLDRLDKPFFWFDLHWGIDRTELLRRAKEWDQALQKYCDDMELAGEERERVIAKHTANPCAPCAYVGCSAFETNARDFQRCGRCRRVAYCRRKCQQMDWDEHRMVCIGIDHDQPLGAPETGS